MTLIHIGRIKRGKAPVTYLFLKKEENLFRWYEGEIPTDISSDTIGEAIDQAHEKWRLNGFRTVICGFRYTLPERDEHGINALFHQMVASYKSPNGIYYDEELGHAAFVQNASKEAYALYKEYR